MEKSNRPIVLSLIPIGDPRFLRYIIADQFLRYWTGTNWTKPKSSDEALLYTDANEASTEIQRLLSIDALEKPVRSFIAPVRIDLYGNEEVSLQDLQSWLLKVSKLVIDSPKHGNGPVDNTLGLASIEWHNLKEIK